MCTKLVTQMEVIVDYDANSALLNWSVALGNRRTVEFMNCELQGFCVRPLNVTVRGLQYQFSVYTEEM